MYKIALIGRTNVGKSTLFNRISKSRDALTFDRPGVTRDSKEKIVEIWGKNAVLIDSPGMFDYAECNDNPLLINAINTKLDEIIKSSDLVVFVIDGILGVTPYDKEIAIHLRKSGKKVILAINKSEKKIANATFIESTELGFEDIIQISAEHGLGISDLFENIEKTIPKQVIIDKEEDNDDNENNKEEIIRLAIIGRPNVGKSTIVNAIIDEEKQLVADFPGLTRESSESEFIFENRKFKIIDTPGLRRKSRIFDVLEKISASTSRKSYKKADVVILLIDASTLECGEIEKQDLTIASNIIKEGKTLLVAFNKYDKTPYKKDDIPKFLKRNFAKSFSQLKEVPFLFVSAKNKVNINKMLSIALSIYDKQKIKISTSSLNNWLYDVNQSDILQSGSAKFKLKYITQVGFTPPAFLIFTTNLDNIREDHKRFILNNLKNNFELKDININVIFKEQERKKK